MHLTGLSALAVIVPSEVRVIAMLVSCMARPAGNVNRWAALAHGVLKMKKCICNLEDGIHEWDCPAVKDSHFYREESQEILDRMAPFFGLEKKQEAGGVRWAEKSASTKSRPTPRAADSPSGYSVKSSMPKGYKFAIVNCPNCQRPVKENWLVKHIKSGCKIPATKNTPSR